MNDTFNKVATGWHKKVLDSLMPVVQTFSQHHKGSVQISGNEISIRILASGCYVTIQIIVRGKSDDSKLEVTGIKRSGIETKRTIFSLKQPEVQVDIPEFKKSLDLALVC